METAGILTSLQGELDGLVQALYCGKRFTCLGKSINGERCGKPLSATTRARLAILLEDIIELLKTTGNGVEILLEEASSLVMCVRFHQGQATAKFVEWSERIPARNCKSAHDGGNFENLHSTPTTELLEYTTSTGPLSNEQKAKSTDTSDTQQFDQYSSSESAQSAFDTNFDDSALGSGNREVLFDNQAVPSMITRTTASPSSVKYTAPKTPQRAVKPVSTDSGISMSFDRSDEAQTKRSIKYRDGSESPLKGKASRAKPVIAGTRSSRPTPTPVQPESLSIRTRKFVPFDDPFVKVRSYIKKPLLGDRDVKEGYIYGFQIEGYAFTKIGSAPERDSEPSLEASFQARMKEHRDSGWPDLKVVLKKRVPHVFRVEKLIHYHLGAGRLKEQCSCVSSSGKKLNHGNYHIEWFNNSLDEIYTVVTAWQLWMLSMPYSVVQGDEYLLSLEWKCCLKNIRIRNGHDIWLQWLCQHVPKLLMLTKKTTLDTNEWIEDESTAEVHGSFTRNNATGIKVEIKKARTNLF